MGTLRTGPRRDGIRRVRTWLVAIQANRRTRRLPGLALACAVPALVFLLAFAYMGPAGSSQIKAAETLAGPSEQAQTPSAVFSATVHVVPSVTAVQIGESLTVSVAIHVSEDCRFPIYELTLRQDEPLFAYTFPPTATVGPPVGNPFTYTLTAVATGTTTLDALAYGERYCNDFWQWHYLNGRSAPVTVWKEQRQVYVPHLRRP